MLKSMIFINKILPNLPSEPNSSFSNWCWKVFDEGLQKRCNPVAGTRFPLTSYSLKAKYQRQTVWKSSAELPVELLDKIYAARRLFTVKEPKLTIVAVIRNKYNDPVEISDAKIRFVAL
jgi:hypothetical protein